MPSLIIKSGPRAGYRFEFGKNVEVGRGATLDLSIDDPTISRRHASFSLDEKGCWIQDLQSQNGTAVNGQVLLKPKLVHDGDELRLGGVRLEFRWEQEPRAPRPSDSVVRLSDAGPAVLRVQQASDPLSSLLRDADPRSIAAITQRLRLVYDIGLTISQTLDEDSMLSLLLEKLFEVFPKAERGFIMLYDSRDGELTAKTVRTRSGESSEIAISRSLVRDVITNGRGVLSVDAQMDGRFVVNKSIQLIGVRSVVCVPMIARDEIYGILTLDSTAAAGAFDPDDMALLLGIGGQAALSLANARLHSRLVRQELMEQDLALAKKIQARFLPKKPPEVAGYDFRSYYSSALEVGGDYYDFLELPESLWGIAVGDVSGKGVSAALYMVKLSSEIRYRSAGQSEPAKILERVNASIARDSEEGMFVTAILLVLDPSTNRLRVASAGHMLPLVRRADGTVIALSSPRNTPLGALAGASFEQSAFELRTGDAVLVYTDGVSEAADHEDHFFGEERLLLAMRRSDGTPEGILTEVLSAVKGFLGRQPQNDDITLVCFGPVSKPPAREVPTKPLAAVRVG